MPDEIPVLEQQYGTCAICGKIWDKHLLDEFRAHWAEMHPARVKHYGEHEPTEGPELGTFYDYVEIKAGAVLMPEAARVAGAPRGMPVLMYQFSSSDKETGPPDVTVHLLISEESLRELRLITGSAIDSAIKLGRRMR